MKTTSIILAAGQGTRMRSSFPKVLHPILGQPMLWYAIAASRAVTQETPVVVVGYDADRVKEALGQDALFVHQEPQLGTGHAVKQADSVLRGKTDYVLVTYGDMPLVTTETLKRLVDAQQAHDGPISVLTAVADDPRGFGRIVRDANGSVLAIVEEVQASPEQLTIHELNTGVFCFSANWLWDALEHIELSPKGEYYLTNVVEIAVSQGQSVQAIRVEDASEMIGINTRVHLAEASAMMQQRINRRWMLAGVTIQDPRSTFIEPGVAIGGDTVIAPNTHLCGETKIGQACQLGPNTVVRDSLIGDRCELFCSVVEHAVLEDDVDVGPFGHLRKGAHLASGVHMGNFGEVKNSYLGPGAKLGHFSYLGDATIGSNVNIGAGTITCNFDGARKHATEIGDDVFIGSDTMLVAPLKVGKGARTGAGAVVTKDVEEKTLVVGMPARAIRKLE
ncbi:MAG: UDP-N-acetylglucosamine diphosphorylase/glucosamine-1-phosphate N-acetyltransferase [Chloroflexi bacterium]|nr:UDP-N-acetylglucosamine diphosphorylase/glucosamine-1-phosphate N-acetyltransferase [Chloroflexota bacterium]